MGDPCEGLVAVGELLEGSIASAHQEVDIYEHGSMSEVVHRGCDRHAQPLDVRCRSLPGQRPPAALGVKHLDCPHQRGGQCSLKCARHREVGTAAHSDGSGSGDRDKLRQLTEEPVQVMERSYVWTPLAFNGWPKTQHQIAVHASGKRWDSRLDIQRQQPGRLLDVTLKPLHPLPAHGVGQGGALVIGS